MSAVLMKNSQLESSRALHYLRALLDQFDMHMHWQSPFCSPLFLLAARAGGKAIIERLSQSHIVQHIVHPHPTPLPLQYILHPTSYAERRP